SPDLLATAPFSFHADVGIRSATVTGVQTCALPILEGALDAQRRFVADASHELRTPLATIQGNAGLLAMGPNVEENVRRAAAADIVGESERMARLTDRLLTLARADSGLDLQLAPVQLAPVAQEVARQAATLHPNLKL